VSIIGVPLYFSLLKIKKMMTHPKSNILEKSKILEITSTLSLLYGLALENIFGSRFQTLILSEPMIQIITDLMLYIQ